MRARKIPRHVLILRATLRAAAWCAICITLLACTPPNFGGDSEPTPLVLSPISASIYLGTSITITASGGTLDYSASDDLGETPTKTSATTWSFHPTTTTGLHTITVTDMSVPEQTKYAEIDVSPAPAELTISPKIITLQVGDTFTFSAVGGTPDYWYDMVPGGVGTVDLNGFYTATAVGKAFIKVHDFLGDTDQAEVDVVDPAEWNARVKVDPENQHWGNFSSLALDSTGAPQIAYWETTVNKCLWIARWIGSWDIDRVDDTNNAEKHPSLALDSSGNARVAWYQAGSLLYRAWNGSDWEAPPLTLASNVGPYASLALDGDGHPHIAYCDDTLDHLRYLEWDGSAWLPPVTVDNEPANTGQYVSLALDDSDNPCIAYYDASNGNLKYAWRTGSTWNYDIIDSVGDVGKYASLKLNGSNYPRIAYYEWIDGTHGKLKYAEWNGSSWDIEIVDSSANNVGQYASLALDPTDQHPHIAFYDASNGNLRYAALNGTIWFSATVDAGPNGGTNDVGKYASLAVDPLTGAMKIAYYDATAFDLLYITEQP